jgi:hypothetical protein
MKKKRIANKSLPHSYREPSQKVRLIFPKNKHTFIKGSGYFVRDSTRLDIHNSKALSEEK